MTEVSVAASLDGRVRPRVLIEDWLPVTELGIESVRESAPIPGQFPKLKTLHVWWARRPLVASAGAILTSLLPAWTPELAERFADAPELANEAAYRKWVLTMCGILGSPIAARDMKAAAVARGERLKDNPYTYKPAFKNNPSTEHVILLHEILEHTWGHHPNLLDPTAGGGSIPFEAVRYRLSTFAGDLNAVAAAILRSGVEIPARYGSDLYTDLYKWGEVLCERLQARLDRFFPSGPSEHVTNYIWVRTIFCPTTGKPTPLVGDWSLRRASKGKPAVAVRLITRTSAGELEEPVYEIVEGSDIDFDPKAEATYGRGKAVSPWTDMAIPGEYIRSEARAGRMENVLYAVAVRAAEGRGFRAPTPTDLEALTAAEAELQRLLPEWGTNDNIPDKAIPEGLKTRELHNYGMPRWRDLFTPRQLLVHGCFVEEYRKLIDEIRSELDKGRADAVLGMLGMIQGKALELELHE